MTSSDLVNECIDSSHTDQIARTSYPEFRRVKIGRVGYQIPIVLGNHYFLYNIIMHVSQIYNACPLYTPGSSEHNSY